MLRQQSNGLYSLVRLPAQWPSGWLQSTNHRKVKPWHHPPAHAADAAQYVLFRLDAGLAAPRDPLRLTEYHDHIPELYGMALMVNRQLAADEPHTVKALLRALNRGLVDTVADPQAAIDRALHTKRSSLPSTRP